MVSRRWIGRVFYKSRAHFSYYLCSFQVIRVRICTFTNVWFEVVTMSVSAIR
jgi:hypothetical protein